MADLEVRSLSFFGCQRLAFDSNGLFYFALQARYEGKHIVLTSHADTLQIAQMWLAGVDPRTFSSFRFKVRVALTHVNVHPF